MPPFGQHFSDQRQFAGGQTLQPQLDGGNMHQQIDRAEIQEGRKDRHQNDLQIGHLGEFAHQEGAGAHQRRHDLTPEMEPIPADAMIAALAGPPR